MNIALEVPPPGIAPPVLQPNMHHCAGCAVFGRGFRRGRKVAVYMGRFLCRRHIEVALARSWRTFRRDAGLPARGRLPVAIGEDALGRACDAWKAEFA